MPISKAPKGRKAKGGAARIEQYEHRDKKRVNNPPVGLVTPDTDAEAGQCCRWSETAEIR